MVNLNTTSIDTLDASKTNGTDIITQNATEISSVNTTPSLLPKNSTQNSTQTINDDNSMMALRLSILAYLLVFFMLLACMRPSTPHTAHRQYIGEDEDYEERQRQRAMRQRHRNEKKKKNKMDPEERKKLVDASLITTMISSCDEESGAVFAQSSHTTPLQTDEKAQQPNNHQRQENVDLDDYDDETSCSCMICLEPYVVGDRVSYSKHNALQCRHVFHKECIADWLMRQDDCPCCRTPYIIQPDDVDNHSNSQQHQCEQANNDRNEQSFDIEADKSLSQDEDDTNGVLYIVDGMISNDMYTLFSITDDDDDEPPSCQDNNTNRNVEDDRRVKSRSSITRRSLFNRSQQHLAAYTSVSISEEENDNALQNDDERNSRVEQINAGDGRDDNETTVHESDYDEEFGDRSIMEDIELGESRDDHDSVTLS